jgi:DNA-binding HxlR family transcriptional regulator
LTDLGRSLAQPIAAIQDWAEGHVGAVLAARNSYDSSVA